MYTIGQIATITGISRDKLRYYEEKGILSPKQNEENNYRQYDCKEIDTVLEINFYRSLDLEVKQIKKLHMENSPERLSSILEEKRRNLLVEIERLNGITKRIEKAQKACSDIEKYLDKFTIKPMAKIKVLDEISDFRAYEEFETVHENKEILEEEPIVNCLKRIITFGPNGILTNKMIITKDVEEETGVIGDNILTYEKCVYTIVEDGPGERDAMPEVFLKSRQWTLENGLVPKGIAIIGIILLFNDIKGMRSYLEVYIPVE